jgi:high-affinity iron transporter
MLATLLIVFREVIEAGLIVGIVMAATRGVRHRGLWVSYGMIAGIIGACLVAIFASQISAAMQGVGQEIFNACILAVAVVMLAWHNVWMARHGRDIAMHMKDVGEAVAHGRRSLMALAIVVSIAVLREGSEVVLFLYGIALSSDDSTFMMGLGGALGLLFGVALGAFTYLGLLKIPNRYLFAVTGWLIALLAAGMAAQAVAFLEQAQIVTGLNHVMWDSSWLLADGSLTGKTLHTLIGYTAQPTGMQLIVYLATLFIIFTLMRLFGHAPQHKKPLTVTATN